MHQYTPPEPAFSGRPAAGVAEVKPRPWRLAVAVAGAMSLSLSGDGILWQTLRPGGPVPWTLAGLALLMAGVGLLLAVRRLAALRLWLSPGGFAVATRDDGHRPFFVGHVVEGGEELWYRTPR
jgi:hypothetical protein